MSEYDDVPEVETGGKGVAGVWMCSTLTSLQWTHLLSTRTRPPREDRRQLQGLAAGDARAAPAAAAGADAGKPAHPAEMTDVGAVAALVDGVADGAEFFLEALTFVEVGLLVGAAETSHGHAAGAARAAAASDQQDERDRGAPSRPDITNGVGDAEGDAGATSGSDAADMGSR